MSSDQSQRNSASFRDPAGSIFTKGDKLFRAVFSPGVPDYKELMESGLYQTLSAAKQLVSHTEVPVTELADIKGVKVLLKPEKFPFISYPYEWSFTSLKRAALLTLAIEEQALAHGMTLKDASAYNVQFVGQKPVFIDTLSFTHYQEGSPWVAYRQFCQHFLAPLVLIATSDIRLSYLQRHYMDGIPLDLAAKLLPQSARWSLGVATHLIFHSRQQTRFAGSRDERTSSLKLTLHARKALLDSLRSTVEKLKAPKQETEWGDYYEDTNYSSASFHSKHEQVKRLIHEVRPVTVWDLGANSGAFSKTALDAGVKHVVAFDVDPQAVDALAQDPSAAGITPLIMDLLNQSSNQGFDQQERSGLRERGPADLVMALALVHHLAIGANIPLQDIAESFTHLGKSLLVEFVPKEDSQVKRLLSTRSDIFPSYTKEGFEEALKPYWEVISCEKVADSKRYLYLFKRS
ncbi:nodulation protein NoeA [soil metagenome]